MVEVKIRYWAAAKEAAGAPEETVEADTLQAALDAVRARRPANADLRRVLERSSFLVDETPVGTRPHGSVHLAPGATIEVLPPFAGG